MSDPFILTNPSEAELAAAVANNLYALFRSMHVIPGCEVLETERLCLHHAFPSNPMFKGVWNARFSPAETETTIAHAVQWFSEREAPAFFWSIDSHTEPADLVQHLRRHGFDGNSAGDPGMVLKLDALDDRLSCPPTFSSRVAIAQPAHDDWRDAFVSAFETSVSEGQAWVDATQSREPEQVPWRLYVGYLDGTPVATSILFTGAGVAGLYGVGTVPHARNQGIGGAITVKTLREAQQQGYQFAVLFASRQGYPVYKRVGFREVACTIGLFVLERD